LLPSLRYFKSTDISGASFLAEDLRALLRS
jgi:hypothetical protein